MNDLHSTQGTAAPGGANKGPTDNGNRGGGHADPKDVTAISGYDSASKALPDALTFEEAQAGNAGGLDEQWGHR